MKSKLAFLVFAVGVSPYAFGHKTNPLLQYTMKSISQDEATMAVPTKKPSAADVTDGMILAGIVRAKTAKYLLDYVNDHKGAIVEGKFVKDEGTPGGLDEEPIDSSTKKLALYTEFLMKAKAGLQKGEDQLLAEFQKENPEARDFGPLKVTLTDLEATIAEAHKIFRPPTTPTP